MGLLTPTMEEVMTTESASAGGMRLIMPLLLSERFGSHPDPDELAAKYRTAILTRTKAAMERPHQSEAARQRIAAARDAAFAVIDEALTAALADRSSSED
jgi:hypothetical protein